MSEFADNYLRPASDQRRENIRKLARLITAFAATQSDPDATIDEIERLARRGLYPDGQRS